MQPEYDLYEYSYNIPLEAREENRGKDGIFGRARVARFSHPTVIFSSASLRVNWKAQVSLVEKVNPGPR